MTEKLFTGMLNHNQTKTKQGFVCPCPGAIYMYMTVIFKDNGALVGGTKVCLRHLGHMIIVAAMPYIIVAAMPILW